MKYLNIVIVIAVIIVIYVIKTYNYFKSQKQEIEKQRSGIEIALTARFDILTKLKDTVTGYTKHETGVLTDVTKIRTGMSISDLSAASEAQEYAFSQLRVLAESYPDLKASVNFVQLQDSVNDVEKNIQATRRLYNNEVSKYNSKIESFPSCVIAKKLNVQHEAYFAADCEKTNDVELKF